MSILEQDQIDKLQEELLNLDNRKALALRAREKIRAMYLDIIGVSCLSSLETINEIGETINSINMKINRSSQYYNSFELLKQAYYKRL